MAHSKSYDNAYIDVTYGPYIFSGWADGDKLTIEYNEDAWSLQVGVEGDYTRSKSNNHSAKITCRLQEMADFNSILQGCFEKDKITGIFTQPLTINYTRTGENYFAEQAWIVKAPTRTQAMESGALEWQLETGNLIWSAS